MKSSDLHRQEVDDWDHRQGVFDDIVCYNGSPLSGDAKMLDQNFREYSRVALRIIIRNRKDEAQIGKLMKILVEDCWAEVSDGGK